MALDSRLTRINETRVRVDNPHGINAVLFVNERVPVESAAVSELLEMLDLHATVERFAEAHPDSFDQAPVAACLGETLLKAMRRSSNSSWNGFAWSVRST